MRFWKLSALVGLFGILGLVTAAAAAQSITWVSVTSDGSGSGGNGFSAVSDDGRFVAFTSSSATLVAGDTNGHSDVFVKDMTTGAIERVSVASGGVQGNGVSGTTTVDISNDGRFVLFDSAASNLVSGDTNARGDMFVVDRQTGDIQRVVRGDGAEGTVASVGALSGNGRFVVFVGQDFDDVPGGGGVFVFDLQTGDVTRVTDGIHNFATSQHSAISDDGRWVAFVTAQFESNRDVILFDRDNPEDWVIANPRLGGESPQSRIAVVAISGNGRFVAFNSHDTNYVPGDTPSTNDVFVFDAEAGLLELIPGGGAAASQNPLPVISDDGRYVAFTAWEDIYGAANGYNDVVVFDRVTEVGEVVSVYNDGSPGDAHSGSTYEPSLSGDGRFVAFATRVPFDPEDSGGSLDFYLVDREGTTGPAPGGACTHDFSDVDSSNIFEDDICWLADAGITRGCNPPANTEFCPTDRVTRGQMAAFLVRALGYADDGGGDLFDDDDASVFEGDIDRLGTAGVTRGCNPPTNSRFCPDDFVTRGQMAAFLVRALGYVDDGGGDLFTDDDGSVFEADIDRLGTAGVTRGCNPPVNDRFCPDDDVTRQQMAAFLRRALEG